MCLRATSFSVLAFWAVCPNSFCNSVEFVSIVCQHHEEVQVAQKCRVPPGAREHRKSDTPDQGFSLKTRSFWCFFIPENSPRGTEPHCSILSQVLASVAFPGLAPCPCTIVYLCSESLKCVFASRGCCVSSSDRKTVLCCVLTVTDC